MTAENLERSFADRATEVGATVHSAASDEEIVRIVEDLLESSTPESSVAILAEDLGRMREPLLATLRARRIEIVQTAAPQNAAAAEVGISSGALAVAETGSVLVAGNDLLDRESSMLPLLHILLVPRANLVAGLDEVGDYLRRAAAGIDGVPLLRYASLVSGPSRTSDVEKTLTIGVHGPRHLHIILTP